MCGARSAESTLNMRAPSMAGLTAMHHALLAGADPLFPLKHFAEFTAVDHPSRASSRATFERRRHVCDANMAVDALNYLHGSGDAAAASAISPGQRSAMKHIWQATGDAQPDAKLTQFGAARELLQLGRAYGSAQPTKTRPYQKGSVSLPAAGRRPVDIRRLLHDPARRFLENHEEWLLHDDEFMAEAHDHAATIRPYMDPALRQPDKYRAFIKELWECGVVSWSRKIRGRVAPFFAEKKNGTLRLAVCDERAGGRG